MKVNFDELFRDDSTLPLDPLLLNSTFTPDDHIKSVNLNSTAQTEQVPSTQPNYFPHQQQSVRRILQFKLALALHEQEQQMSRRPPIIELKRRSGVDVFEVSRRLHNNKISSDDCCKNCTKYKSEKQLKIQEEIELMNQVKQKYKRNVVQQSQPSDGLISQRLHNYAKYKEIKLWELKLKYQRQYKSTHSQFKKIHRDPYLEKDYMSFFQRYEQELRKIAEKKKIFQKNPFFLEAYSKKYFTPSKMNNKYQDVQSRYWKDRTHNTHCDHVSYINDFQYSSLNTSMMSSMSLDRSIDLVNSIEEYFFDKMRLIFVSRGKQFVEVSEEKIMLLTEIEFKVMLEFIQELQEGTIRSEDFEDKLRTYYNNLQFRDKQELRWHQKKAKRAEQPRRPTLPASKSAISTKCKPEKRSFKKHPKNMHHTKLQAFV